MNSDITSQPISGNENAIRLLILGAFYAGAVFFTVALSPAIGFFSPDIEPGKIASAETGIRPGQ